MKRILKRIARNAAIATGTVFNMRRRADYRNLSHYILDINRMHDLDGMLREGSRCLRDLLNCRLFALVLQEGEKLTVWSDPAVYRGLLGRIVARDFDHDGDYTTRLIGENQKDRVLQIIFKEEDILSYVLMDDNCYARIYLLPRGKTVSRHADMLHIIIRSLATALTNHMNIRRLENEVAFDPLTNCYNRREFARLIEHHIADARRHDRPLSLIMFDIDHFKNVNDTHGHQAGDEVLKVIADVVRSGIRKEDYLVRYGGEEFVVVLPNTRHTNAIELAERLRRQIAGHRFHMPERSALSITASFGISALRPGTNRDALIKEADEMLYKAKTGSRNMVMPQLKLRLMEQTSFADEKRCGSFGDLAFTGT